MTFLEESQILGESLAKDNVEGSPEVSPWEMVTAFAGSSIIEDDVSLRYKGSVLIWFLYYF